MCGIAGVYSLRDGLPPVELGVLRQMGSALHHRGPDEFGIYRDQRLGLAHTRLSIVDLASGQQPLSNEDGTLWVAFNGEIFNYVELRRELVAKGHRFRTQSDTEVIVHAYEQWGGDAFRRFNGQWAIALWDARRRRLVLSRDRLGVRPLYLAKHGERLYFASEVKAIFAASADIPRALDPAGLEETFTFWTVVAPQSVFAGIEELPPGYTRTFSGERVSDDQYWQPRFPLMTGSGGRAGEFGDTPARAAREVLAALQQATELRMVRADVPVGAYLSGGLDSSLIAALAARTQTRRLRTFSIQFDDAEYDESVFQQAVASALGTEHRSITVSNEDIAAVFPEVVFHAERPLLRTAAAPLYLLSRLVSDSGIKVVLTGEGADEMFAGYDLFREARIRRFWARRPGSQWRPQLLGRLYPYLSRSPVARAGFARQFFGRNLAGAQKPGFSHDLRWQTTAALKRLFAPGVRAAAAAMNRGDVVADLLDRLPADFHRWSPLAQDQYVETHTLLSGYLLGSQGDRMMMANSVEGRFPFLDVDVVELANSLPPEYKLRGLSEKHVLKQAGRGLVAPEVLARQKQPYRAPDARAFLGPSVPAWIGEMLAPRALADAGVFRPEAIARLWAKLCGHPDARQSSNADNMAIVGVLSTQLLHHYFIRQRPLPDRLARVTRVVDGFAAAA